MRGAMDLPPWHRGRILGMERLQKHLKSIPSNKSTAMKVCFVSGRDQVLFARDVLHSQGVLTALNGTGLESEGGTGRAPRHPAY